MKADFEKWLFKHPKYGNTWLNENTTIEEKEIVNQFAEEYAKEIIDKQEHEKAISKTIEHFTKKR